jgi:hypothetical protein
MITYATIAQMGIIAFGIGSVAIRCLRSFGKVSKGSINLAGVAHANYMQLKSE